MKGLLFAAMLASAVWFALPPDAHRPRTFTPRTRIDHTTERPSRPWLWACSAAVGAWAFVGDVAGACIGALVGVVVWAIVARSEPPAVRRRRLLVRSELPHVVTLLAAAISGGLAPAPAVKLVCQALPGPAADALASVPPRIELGADPVDVWRSLVDDEALAPLGRALSRSARTGEPVAEALDRLGAELAARARTETEDAARRVGVQAAVPLGLCLLPAFLLLGVVPVVAALVLELTR